MLFRVFLDDDDIINVRNDVLNANIQFNKKSLISISLPTILKGKLCGLCALNENNNC
jgi:hypothetical protein